MASIENFSSNLIKALDDKDFLAYTRSRTAIVSTIADEDFMVDLIQDYFVVGKALTIVLDDLLKSGLIYKRVVITALYCLLKNIISDKQNLRQDTAIASAYLYIIYAENVDFIGAEYMLEKLQDNIDAAGHQLIGMMYVFLWNFKLGSHPISFEDRTKCRLQNAMEKSITDIPDEYTRRKIIDFEYKNFQSMVRYLQLDLDVKYPGVPFFEPEDVFQGIQTMFKTSSLYFTSNSSLGKNNISNNSKPVSSLSKESLKVQRNNVRYLSNKKNDSGCLSSIIIMFIIIVFMVAISLI